MAGRRFASARRCCGDDLVSRPEHEKPLLANWDPINALGAYRAMGSYKGSRTADLEYPLAFLEQMARVLETRPTRPRFRYIHLGGMFTRHDQEKKLWLLEYPRKIRVGSDLYMSFKI